jgi:phytol kinase
MMNFWFYFVVLIALILVINWYGKKAQLKTQFIRKLTHIVTGLIGSSFPFYLTLNQIITLSVLFFILMFVAKLKKMLVLNNIERVSWGEVYFPISVGICALISLPEHTSAFVAGILTLTFSDSLANIVGSTYPIKKFTMNGQTKSVGGFLACFLTSLVLFAILLQPSTGSWYLIPVFALAVGLVEFVSTHGTDNITVPVAATLLSLMLK